ncbi:glycosyltransferase family A protein [Salinisphaera sp. SPP-AMP-43]|uniref:glycosyltransferase n=1 Tax=Salinisphaera sp. SPP-AMP-43 TaxID=3121288 RepID=UPI003C6E6BCC
MNTTADNKVRTAPILVISPMRDEARFVDAAIEAMLTQTVRPAAWVIVDDGSSDDTALQVARYAAQSDFIHLIQRNDRGRRRVGAGVIEAFNHGLAHAPIDDWRYIVKLDADITYGPRYIETMLAAFAVDPKLAAISGRVYRPEPGGDVEERKSPDMVAGPFKFYRREAFEAIGGFEQTLQWDGIDIHRARMTGWRTANIDHPDARIHHHRLMGSSQVSIVHGRLRWGRGIHFMGYHPAYVAAVGIYRMPEKPYVIGGLLIMTGYFHATARRRPQYPDPVFRADLQRWQKARLAKLVSRAFARLRGSEPSP